MSKKNQTSITSDSREDMPPRGKSKRTLILDAIRENTLLGLKEGATREEAEQAYFLNLVKKSINIKDNDSGLCLRLLTERGWSALKPSSDCVQFEFDKDATPTAQASQVMDAVSNGDIPPDLGLAFVSGIKSMVEVEANTELKERIEKLEAMINGSAG